MPTIDLTLAQTVGGGVSYKIKSASCQHSMIRQPVYVPLPTAPSATDPTYVFRDLGMLAEQFVIQGVLSDDDPGGTGNPPSKINLENAGANWWKDIDYTTNPPTNLTRLTFVGVNRAWDGYIERMDFYQKGGEPLWNYQIIFKSINPPARS